MFSDHSITSSGKHLLCDLKNIRNSEVMENVELIEQILDEICETYDFTVLKKLNHIFDPQGISIIYLLSESHISVHTFPEKNCIAMDIYTCRQYPDNTVYNEIHDFLVRVFDADAEPPKIIDREFMNGLK